MFRAGEQVTSTKLKDIFMRMFLQSNAIDPSQIRAITCGQFIGTEAVTSREYEGYSSCADQYWCRPYLNDADFAATPKLSFISKFIKDVAMIKEK